MHDHPPDRPRRTSSDLGDHQKRAVGPWGCRRHRRTLRAAVDVTVEPLNGTAQPRVTIALDFEGHGIGKLLIPLVVRRQARARWVNLKRLKQRLETS
jgi:GNAT superfamily N-acetyltransferase